MKRRLIIISLILVSIITWSFSVLEYYNLRNNINYLSLREDLRFLRIPSHKLSASDVDLIGSWMTFYYINEVFNIPDLILKDKLNIINKRYPNISIRQYVKDESINTEIFLENVKKIVKEYILTNPKQK